MPLHVAKAFNTHNRRLEKGASVAASEDFAPFRFADLERRGFIKETVVPAAKPAAPRPARDKD